MHQDNPFYISLKQGNFFSKEELDGLLDLEIEIEGGCSWKARHVMPTDCGGSAKSMLPWKWILAALKASKFPLGQWTKKSWHLLALFFMSTNGRTTWALGGHKDLEDMWAAAHGKPWQERVSAFKAMEALRVTPSALLQPEDVQRQIDAWEAESQFALLQVARLKRLLPLEDDNTKRQRLDGDSQ
jgi:hypothetical protein